MGRSLAALAASWPQPLAAVGEVPGAAVGPPLICLREQMRMTRLVVLASTKALDAVMECCRSKGCENTFCSMLPLRKASGCDNHVASCESHPVTTVAKGLCRTSPAFPT